MSTPSSPALERKREIESEIKQLELAKLRGELVPADHAKAVIEQMLDGVRERILSIPYHSSDDPELAEEIRLHIVQAMTDLQGDDDE